MTVERIETSMPQEKKTARGNAMRSSFLSPQAAQPLAV
jgi:hypothetical protein